MKLTDLSQSLSTITFSTFCTFQSFKNVKMKAHSDYNSESTWPKGSIPQTCPKVLQKFGKTRRISRRASAMKYIFNKIVDTHYLSQNQTVPLMISCNTLKIIEDNFWSCIFYHNLTQVETYLKNYHTKSSYIKSQDNLILKSILLIARSNQLMV